MSKLYKVLFTTGKEITIEASYAKYVRVPSINKDALVYYDSDGTVLGTFLVDKVLGDMVISVNNKEEQQSTEAIGFQLPKEEPACLKNQTES